MVIKNKSMSNLNTWFLLKKLSDLKSNNCVILIKDIGILYLEPFHYNNILSANYDHRIKDIDYAVSCEKFDFSKKIYACAFVDEELIIKEIFIKRSYKKLNFCEREIYFGEYTVLTINYDKSTGFMDWEV